MKILGIETSCDETAAAVVAGGTKILSNQIISQVEIHARYGGIVPEVASRQHILAIIPTIERAMAEAGTKWSDLDGIAVTIGPGLAGSLLVGLNVAKAISLARRLPITGVNHLEGHIYANWLNHNPDFATSFPLICLIVSGGHSDLALMREHGDYIILGRTRDDAAGEAFDKAARVLGLGYPGGPALEQAAKSGNTTSIKLPRAWLKDSNDFSFSGVKTAMLRLVDEGVSCKADAAASFQEAIIDVLVTKTVAVAKERRVKQILLAGGVASNKLLRQRLVQNSPIPVLIPEPVLCTDNAAMIAACGYYRFQASKIDGLDLDVVPSLKLG